MTTFQRESIKYLENGGIITLHIVELSLAGALLDNSVLLLDLILMVLMLRAIGVDYGIGIVWPVVLIINVAI